MFFFSKIKGLYALKEFKFPPKFLGYLMSHRWEAPTVELEVEVNLRPTVSRPVCLGVRHPSGTRDQFFFLL
jgi:hypothetical protein